MVPCQRLSIVKNQLNPMLSRSYLIILDPSSPTLLIVLSHELYVTHRVCQILMKNDVILDSNFSTMGSSVFLSSSAFIGDVISFKLSTKVY